MRRAGRPVLVAGGTQGPLTRAAYAVGPDRAAAMITMEFGWYVACSFLVRYDREGAEWCNCTIVHVPDPALDARLETFWPRNGGRRRHFSAMTRFLLAGGSAGARIVQSRWHTRSGDRG